jgi:hypothetical protein
MYRVNMRLPYGFNERLSKDKRRIVERLFDFHFIFIPAIHRFMTIVNNPGRCRLWHAKSSIGKDVAVKKY